MAGHPHKPRPPRTAAATAAALVLLAGCAVAGPPADPAVEEIRRTLDARAAALLGHDRAAYLASLEPGAAALREAQGEEFDNLADVPLGSWEYLVKDVRHHGATAVADAEVRYRIAGYDTAPMTVSRTLELAERDGRWYVTADRAGTGTGTPRQQLWQQGDVDVARGSHSIVLGVGQDQERLRDLAAAADRAVPAVSDAWPSKWAGRVVVLVPASVEGMGGLLGAPAAGYRGIAAVTTGETNREVESPADRVVVNPEAYALLGDFGQGVVLTHEATHVATRAHTSAVTPMWLSEGFADWVAYRGTGRTAAEAAPEMQEAVRAGDVPAGLPDDRDFSFDGDAGALARAYEGGRLACAMIAERWGEEKLTAFYRTVGEGQYRDGAVERALSEELGTTAAELTAMWRDYLTGVLD
ncbi:hypothetical protein [Streptomyces peucetius]|uniref:Lipoprotein n=1 Tax=Streptomyces peucetius TaxID=1950 RepID=A0ABY6I3X4_STRPE|nr:hypothetical protein [Streptomyces peucetius]UYQ61670.1 hypothetical protein OGH68_09360 [Streptomyces peucetius]